MKNVRWISLKSQLENKYKITKESDNTVSLVFAFDVNGVKRSQVVFVTRSETNSGVEWIEILSRVGQIVPKRLDSALTKLTDTLVGGMIKIGENYFLRSCVLIEALDFQLLDDMMSSVYMTADNFEAEYVGGDEN